MCLAVPMLIVKMLGGSRAVADVDGNRCEVDVSLIEAPRIGEYIIVHAGFAIEKLDADEADKRLELFQELAAHRRAADEVH